MVIDLIARLVETEAQKNRLTPVLREFQMATTVTAKG